VFLVESLGYNLLSVSQLCNMGYNCLFTNVDVSVFRRSDGSLAFKGVLNGKLYLVDFSKEEVVLDACLIAKTSMGWLWLHRLAHLYYSICYDCRCPQPVFYHRARSPRSRPAVPPPSTAAPQSRNSAVPAFTAPSCPQSPPGTGPLPQTLPSSGLCRKPRMRRLHRTPHPSS
jgi:hypothetical protein